MTATVSAGMAGGVVTYARARGVDGDELWANAGLAPVAFEPDARVALDVYLALVAAARSLTADDAFSLHYGADVPMSELSIVGLIMEASATMAQALEQLQRYGRLAADIAGVEGSQLTLKQDHADLFLVAHGMDSYAELIEESFARLATGPRRFLQQRHVVAAHFAYAPPSHHAEYARVLDCPVHFDAPETMLQLHPDVGGWPVAPHARYVFGTLSTAAEHQLAKHTPAGAWSQRVATHVRSTVHEGNSTAESTARALHCSRSTLSRRLAEEGTDHSTIVDSVRQELAVSYLYGGRVSVSQVAYLVGFSDPSAFIRAFKRWTGSSPGSYRADRRGATT